MSNMDPIADILTEEASKEFPEMSGGGNPIPKETETLEERLARQKEQLKRGEELLAEEREALAEGAKVLGKKEGNPMTPDEIDQIATKVAAKVLDEITPTVLDPAGRGMLLHFTEHEIEGAGLVINEAKARATPCNCFTYNDREYCFSPGIIGMISSKENPEQLAEYCKLGKSYEVKPGIKKRFESFAEAAEEAHKKIEEIPKGERLVPWLSAMGEELEKRGIEV